MQQPEISIHPLIGRLLYAGSFYQSSTNVELSYYIKKEQKSKMISAHKNHVDPTYRPD